VMDAAPVAIWLADDPDCRHITGNRTANQFYEAKSDENVSAGPVSGGEHEAGRALEFEEHTQLNGRSITWLTTKFPLRDAQGKVYAVAGMSTDITERQRAEQALRASEQRLAPGFLGVVIDVTGRKQAEDALREVNAALAEADRRKDEFIAVLSHELRSGQIECRSGAGLAERRPGSSRSGAHQPPGQ
jgi:PAS domain-containing protein